MGYLAADTPFLSLLLRESHGRSPVPGDRERGGDMENGSKKRWGFQGNQKLNKAATFTIREVLRTVQSNLTEEEKRPVITLGQGDPSAFPCFRTTPVAEDAIADAVRSAKFNCYAPNVGILPARR